MLIHYKDYVARWNEIVEIFSPEAVRKGSFAKYVEGMKGKKGTADVDDAFLQEIERWRELLAKNIALRNHTIDIAGLNYAVQMTIDRIVFLRICEERGIEPENQLQEIVSRDGIYSELGKLFKRADTKYNSGLFHFKPEKGQNSRPDDLTLSLNIDDKVLKDIISNLYYPKSPYAFLYIPADILGQVYERFLGKVIRLTAGHQAKVEEKPEVRKAGGVYYTPTYIVDYIVKNTVGKLVENKSPKDVAAFKIVDPACGSGTFLLGAYQFLLDWHLSWYVENEPEKAEKNKAIVKVGDSYRLTTAQKKEILLNNIFGVDIDAQAVEVTKLSLLLKVLENASGQLGLGMERVLPDLGNNIKCGNSLIGFDYFEGKLIPDEAERTRINPFDWKNEFKEVFANGGFDAVIGNPPYGQVIDNALKKYFDNTFNSMEGRFDTFELFLEKGIGLCKQKGILGYIIPSTVLTNLYSRKLRKFIVENCSVDEITNFGMDVFSDPTVHTCIVFLINQKDKNLTKIRKQVTEVTQLNDSYNYMMPQSSLGANANFTFDIFVDPIIGNLLNNLSKQSRLLGDICFIRQCIKTGDDELYVEKFETTPDAPWKPTLRGRSILRYTTIEKREYLKYGDWLARNWQNKSFYETPKIAIRETGNRIIATLDLEFRYFLSSLYAIYPKLADEQLFLEYLLGILNSKIATFVAKVIALDLTDGAFTKFRTNQLARIPIRTINFSDPADKARHDRMVTLVESMLELHKRLPNAQTPQEKESLERQIAVTDKAIDSLVYELYGLTDDEIKIVEGSR